jgi:predicted lipoprotein
MVEFRVPTHVTTTFFDESAVLLDFRKNIYYALNSSAADFWKSITQMSSFEAALKQVSELYEDTSDVIRKDMEELVNSLVKAGLLERVNS